MKTSISTLSVANSLEDKLAAFSAAGFDGIEIAEQDFAVQGRTPSEIGQMVRDHGLAIHLFQTPIEFEGLPGEERARALRRLEHRFDVMQELGTDLLLLGSGNSEACIGGVDRIAGDLAFLGERAAVRGLRIAYEARPWSRHISDYRDAWEVVRRAGHRAVGLALDSFNILSRNLSLTNIRVIPADRIFHVQLADAPAVEMDLEFKSQNLRLLPGEGVLPVVDFLRAVAATGYAGVYSLDLVNNRSRNSARRLALDGHRALIAAADAARRAETSCSFDLPDIPDKATIEGVEFVEFAAGGEDAAALSRMLKELGFTQVARHKSRDVSLWRQNGINIVINSETRGYAHSAYVMHGTSVCDIGLLVEDAEAAATRTEMLGARRFAQQRHSGELNIPAVRGVGGSVLHFLDRKTRLGKVWETEFDPLPEEAADPSAGLERIDHVAQVMKQEELESWMLFYTSIFNSEKASETGVADPGGGLVQSRALQGKDGTYRLTLNGVDTHRTFAGRFLADSFGASVQHLAFVTGDMIGTARKLADNGFESLTVPDSYYEELASDFELSSDEVEQFRQLNILYDRDENGGRFLQLYSRAHGDGFFFEIVERTGGYDGYGARNAPYRTAALKRLSTP